MATYPITVTNPDAETGDMTGWTDKPGTEGMSVAAGVAHSGTYAFSSDAAFNEGLAGAFQNVNIAAPEIALIDAGLVVLWCKAWHRSDEATDTGTHTITMYSGLNGTGTILGTASSAAHTGAYAQRSASIFAAAGTRSVRINLDCVNGDFSASYGNFWDDVELYLDDTPSVSVTDYMLGAYALGSKIADNAIANQVGAQILGAAETASGEHDVLAHTLGVYVLVRGRPDTRRLRAWTFPQDEHDFYVLHLGRDRTIVFDTLSRVWASWRSPTKSVWRGSDGMAWEHENIAGDVTQGLIWNIDANSRLDDEITGLPDVQTPIRTVVRGMVSMRLRNALSCYRATLTVAQGSPAAAGVGLQLRTSIDEAKSFVDHGFLLMDQPGKIYDVSWVSLGLITEPGMIFEIIDTGYTRRISALDIDLGQEEGQSGNN